MKKLMVMIGIAMAAVASHAACCVWSASNIAANEGSLVLLMYSQNTKTPDQILSQTDALKYINGTDGLKIADLVGKAAKVSSVSAGKGITSGTARDNRTGGASWGAGDTVQGYAIIFDAADIADAQNYLITDLSTAQNFTSTGQTKTFALGSQEGKTWSSVPGSDTPEPTSGLLVLVGLAGLALRRKQA